MMNALPADRVRPDSYRGHSGGASPEHSGRRWEELGRGRLVRVFLGDRNFNLVSNDYFSDKT